MGREGSDSIGMARGNRQQIYSCPFQLVEQVVRSVELSELTLYRDLPDHDGAHNHVVTGDLLPCRGTNPVLFPGEPPEHDVGVEQEGQDRMPSASARSSGSSSKS